MIEIETFEFQGQMWCKGKSPRPYSPGVDVVVIVKQCDEQRLIERIRRDYAELERVSKTHRGAEL